MRIRLSESDPVTLSQGGNPRPRRESDFPSGVPDNTEHAHSAVVAADATVVGAPLPTSSCSAATAAKF